MHGFAEVHSRAGDSNSRSDSSPDRNTCPDAARYTYSCSDSFANPAGDSHASADSCYYSDACDNSDPCSNGNSHTHSKAGARSAPVRKRAC